MKGKKMLFKPKSLLLLCVASLGFGLLMGACSKSDSPVKPTIPAKEMPATIADCVPADIEALRAIAKANPEIHLFEGDDPSRWKTIRLKWVKNETGKYAVSTLSLEGKDVLINDFVLHLDGSKKGNTVLSHLQRVDITAAVKEVIILAQPALETVRINGAGKAQAEKVNVQGDKILKEVVIEAMPQLTAIMLGGDALEKVTLVDLPKLQDQSNLKFRSGYDDEGNQVEDTKLKELVLGGDLSLLDGLYLRGLNLEKLTLQTSLPQLKSLTLNNNRLSGSFELKGLANLTILNLAKNLLVAVKVSDCPKLEEFDASANKELKECELSLPALKTLDLNETNLTKIDLSSFANLKKASAYSAKITSVNLGNQNKKLSTVNFSDNQLAELNFPKEASSVYLLTLNKNVIKSLNLSMMPDLERVSVSSNQLEDLKVGEEAESFEELECKNNHLSAKLLRQIKNTLSTLNKWEIAPQYLLGRVDVEKKQIRATEEINELRLVPKVQKKNGNKWVDAGASDFRLENGIYTIMGKGTFRVIYTGSILEPGVGNFSTFSLSDPYVIGEINV
ncbi:MAG: hypothetical protein SPJ29_05250 [Phocaeicola sp.]|nr:hypothetical protein [Phocaeicola sp.]MDY3914847.1 hypothetical protein [Phocaeicola sp.]MDY5939143.1 hypothetical protein [Phocaeicola sp.]